MESSALLNAPVTRPLERPLARPPASAPAPRRRPSLPWGPLLALVLVGAWWIVAPRTPDLAAQVYRVWLFEHAGFVLWDNSWYAGHHIPGYSLIFPPFAALVGVRALGGMAIILSAWIFEALARSLYGRRTIAAALWFAVAASADAWIGRLTFALGVTFALAACLAFVRAQSATGRWRPVPMSLAALTATLAAATSPVAGLLLVLAVLSWAVADGYVAWRAGGALTARLRGDQTNGDGEAVAPWGDLAPHHETGMRGLFGLCLGRGRFALVLVAGPVAVVLAMQLLFPEGGYEPYGANSLLATLAVTLAFIVALPRREHLLRVAALIYLVANLSAEIPTPMGSNLQRYAVLLAGPLLLCALTGERRGLRVGGRFMRGVGTGTESVVGNVHRPRAPSGHERDASRASLLPRPALAAALAGMAFWALWGPVMQTRQVLGDSSVRASYYVPVRNFFAGLKDGGPLRVEVPFTLSHWEAALLAPHIMLARGWERQLDKRYNRPLESSALTAAAYRAWLDEYGVSYVALPDASFDESSYAEVRLIRGGLPYLHEVFRSAHWRIFRVLHPAPLVVGPAEASPAVGASQGARLLSMGHDSFTLAAGVPGRYLVKVHFTPYWTVTSGSAAQGEGARNLTIVQVRRAGRVRVTARFTLAGALGAIGTAL